MLYTRIKTLILTTSISLLAVLWIAQIYIHRMAPPFLVLGGMSMPTDAWISFGVIASAVLSGVILTVSTISHVRLAADVQCLREMLELPDSVLSVDLLVHTLTHAAYVAVAAWVTAGYIMM